MSLALIKLGWGNVNAIELANDLQRPQNKCCGASQLA